MGTQQSMKAIEIDASGQLQSCERDVPTPKAGEVLIKVAAAGINRADLLQRKGHHPPPPGASDLPGLEVSGTIAEVGDGISRAMIGEPVCALLSGGGYAEYATASLSQCLPLSDEIDLISAAGLPEAMFTVAKNIFIMGQLRADDHLLIHGGSSGIGTIGIQMARVAGARISVTAGTQEKCDLCLSLGADRAINYKEQDFAELLKGDGVDVVLDMVGGNYINRDLSLMNTGGRHVSIAYLQNQKAEIDIGTVMKRRLMITGSTLRHDSDEDKQGYAELIKDVFWPEVASGEIKPVIHATYPLMQAREAHDFFSKGVHSGKILLIA